MALTTSEKKEIETLIKQVKEILIKEEILWKS